MKETKLISAWFGGMSDKEKEDFKNILLSNTILLDKLAEIVYNMLMKEGKITSSSYDNTSWAYKQAHINGKTEVLRQMLSLVDINRKFGQYE